MAARVETLSRHLAGSSREKRPAQRVAVITGVTSGIGRALAIGLAADGWIVCGCGRRQEQLHSLQTEIGPRHVLRKADVNDFRSMEAFASAVAARGLDVELLVCNSGIAIKALPVHETAPADFERLIKTNVIGVFHTIRAFVPRMVSLAEPSKRLKKVIGISSGLGHSTSDRLGAYSASKWAVEAMLKSVAQSVANAGVHMIAVPLAPGVLQTEMNRKGNSVPGKDLASWVKTAVPFVTELGKESNGASISVPGFYHPDYLATWVIPDGMPLATAVVRPG